MLQTKQKGFTLLELLVVITLLALLSVGALVAYDGIDENASASTAANNIQVTDRTVRQYVAVTGNYPNQWDVLTNETDATLTWDGVSAADISAGTYDDDELIVAMSTREAFGGWNVNGAGEVGEKVLNSLIEYGIDELQFVNLTAPVTLPDGVLPNNAHNEGANPEGGEVDTDEALTLSILPTGGTCQAGGQPIGTNFNGGLGDNAGYNKQLARINSINDFLEDNRCNLILALGFGHDAGQSMQNSSVQMTSSPSYSSRNINPATQYGRFIGLFHVGAGAEEATDTNFPTAQQAPNIETAADIFDRPKLIAILTPEGENVDEVLARARSTTDGE